MTDNTDSSIAMLLVRSAALIDEDIACAVPELTYGNHSWVNQDVALKEKFGKYCEYYETVKDKVVNFMRGSIALPKMEARKLSKLLLQRKVRD